MLHCVSRHVQAACITSHFSRPAARLAFSGLHRLSILPRNFQVKRASTLSSPRVTLSDAQKKTIYALSTPPGRAGVGVVRVSGPDALNVWKAVVRPSKGSRNDAPEPWKFYRCRICHPGKQEVLDDGLAVFFKCE